MAKIIRAAQVAQDTGAKIVGLGAMTSVVGDQGITVAKHVDIAVTTGNSYTVWTAVEGAKQAAQLDGHRSRAGARGRPGRDRLHRPGLREDSGRGSGRRHAHRPQRGAA